MSFIKNAVLAVSALAALQTVVAHGLVESILLDGVSYQGYPAFNAQNNPERIVRAMFNNGPIEDVTSKAIACNGEDTPAALVAPVTAGSTATFKWDTWPDSHKGPITNYMASCGAAGCKSFDATTGKFFKVDEAGLDNGVWASDALIKNGLKYSFKIPSNIPDGEYLIRHEILALHSTGAPQYYPSCTQVKVTGGSGSLPTTNLASFPGAYSKSDPGFSFNIYFPVPTSYPIQGPALFDSGSSGAPASSSAAATSAAVTSSVVATSAAGAATSVVSSSVAGTTSAAVTSAAVATSSAVISSVVATSTKVAVITSSAAAGTCGPKSTVTVTVTATATGSPSTTTASGAPATTSGAALAGNVQTFTEALGGQAAPGVTPGGKGFQVEGSDSFINKAGALGRSCDIQHNKCANFANTSGNKDVTVALCDAQNTKCHAAITAAKRSVAHAPRYVRLLRR